ncbi:MAG: CotH kinase family protein, partial [Bacteroidota bacterium]|nr:CotH kinase family protein [Bacteroidota bacterium]
MRHFYLFVLLLTGSITYSFSQTFTGSGGPIPDNGNSVDYTISVSGLPSIIDTLTFGLEEVCIDIVHTWDSDLDITLIAPDGTSVLLVSGAGGGGDDFTGTCFMQDAATSILQGNAPFTGTFRPLSQMGKVNNGQDPNGLWTLHIQDTYPFADAGTLLSWSVSFGNDPASYFEMESTNLPLVIINTNGQTITADPKVTAWMSIINNGPVIRNYVNDPPNDYNGYIGIDLRGHSSMTFVQKQYGIETRDSAGNNLNTTILGMPAENDWVLYAPYTDKSLMRNPLTYSLAMDMGRYASRERFCEVIINGEYKGIYTFFEKIKRDNNRVNIAGLTQSDTTGIALTGGYICSLDWIDNDGWTSNYPPDPTNPGSNTIFYQYIYPKDTEMLPVQKTYIQQYVDSFETALVAASFADPLTGWRNYADEGSFIDYFLMNEISKNVDGYRLSAFFYKEKLTDGGKINMGPLWDFNLAWHNADYCDNESYGGWAYLFPNSCQWDFPFWWRRLNEDTTFQNNVRCRWDDLRTSIFDTTHIFNYIDSIAGILDEGQQRHYYLYPILGIFVWPNPSPLAQTYQEEIVFLKNWILQRIIFMDDYLPGACITTALNETSTDWQLTVSPNPA